LRTSTHTEDAIHLRDYLFLAYKRRWLIIGCFLLVFLGTSYITFTATPVYEAKSTIRIEQSQNASSLFSQRSNLSYYKLMGRLETEIEVLKSRSIAERVVTRLGLPLDPSDSGFTKQELFETVNVTREAIPGEYKIFFKEDGSFELFLEDNLILTSRIGSPVELIGLSFKFHPSLKTVPKKLEFAILDFDSAVKDFMKNSEAQPVKDTDIIKISVKGHDPSEVRRMVNTWAQEFLTEGLSFTKLEARSMRQFLEEQLSVVSDQLEQSEEDLRDFKEASQVVVLSIEAESRIGELSGFEGQKAEAKTERDGIRRFLRKIEAGKENSAPGDVGFWELTAFPSLINNETIWRLKDQLVGLSVREKELSQVLEDTHPDIMVIKSQIDLVERDLRREADSYIKALDSKIEALDETIARFQEQLEKLPDKEIQLARLERKAKVNEEIYTLLLKKHKEAQISEAIEIGDLRIVDPGIRPKYPVKPNKKLNLALGLIVGLVFGISLACLVEYFDTTIKNWEDVSKRLDLPMLGSIPRIRPSKSARIDKSHGAAALYGESLISHSDSKSPISEAYKTIRTNIQYFDITDKMQTLLFTSPGPKEGKSTTVSNLAVTLSQQGVKTLIVDADLRKPVMARTFRMSKTPGLTDILVGKANLSMCIAETGIENLYLLPSGTIPPNPSELLSSSKMTELLELLREAFPIVLLDSPPVLAVTDASILAQKTDGVVLVIRSEVTEEEAAVMAKHHLEHVKARIIGCVINDFNFETSYYRKGYYQYYTYYSRSEDDGGHKSRKQRAKNIKPAQSRKNNVFNFW